MFTGLVQGMGRVVDLLPEANGVRLRIGPPPPLDEDDRPSDQVQIGESIAINGCCLTIVSADDDTWEFQAGSETLSRTNLGKLATGDAVNIERSLKVGDRLGGHIVQGHIDGIAEVLRIEPEGEWTKLWFQVSRDLTSQMVSKGSVAVDGVSLTLVDVTRDSFSVALIPHTLQVTTLGMRQLNDPVNIETDILGKYVQKLLHTAESRQSAS